jgi:hypothetical protein
LALAFLVHREDQGVVRRVQVQPDHIAQFFDEESIGGELKLSVRCGLTPKSWK